MRSKVTQNLVYDDQAVAVAVVVVVAVAVRL